ncbi:LSU ribosomal protein L15P [Abditibacterium utsteinense]|uniref:Large ribosomal subunit protein uL15 n=1 Tax=Abditibacterium utsteinense TaxID=1960156 RepID=A0A2S8ST28_9BACT|nr:LSU ribosomal protein L15P [Abditibacterium utsteinense]
MELLTLTNLRPAKGARKKKKRVGRGIGSGHGKTSTRGQKGQHSRNTVAPGFEGGQTPLFRRLPKLRGKGKGAMPIGPTRKFYAIANMEQLERFPAGTAITAELLRSEGIVKGRWDGLRILGVGEITKAVTVHAEHFTATAREKIEAAGGTCEVIVHISPSGRKPKVAATTDEA